MSVEIIVINFICYAMWFTAIHLLTERKYSLPVTVTVEALVFPLYFFVTTASTGNLTVPRLLLGMSFISLTTLLLHRGKWYFKLLLVFLVMCMMLLSEFLTACIVPADLLSEGILSGSYDYHLAFYGLYLFCQAILLAVMVIVGRSLENRHAGAAASRQSLLFLLFPFSQLLLLAGLFLPFSSGGLLIRPLYLFLAILLCAAADAGLAIAMYYISKAADLRAQNQLLEQQISEQGAYYAAATAHYEQVRRLRHDLDNHLYTIKILIDDGKTDEAAQYAAEFARAEQEALRAEVLEV